MASPELVEHLAAFLRLNLDQGTETPRMTILRGLTEFARNGGELPLADNERKAAVVAEVSHQPRYDREHMLTHID